MRPLYIPGWKEELELAEDWTFELEEERRNLTLIKKVDEYYCGSGWPKWVDRVQVPMKWKVTIPARTKLIVERVYTPCMKNRVASITFRTTYEGKKVRFWVRLSEANRIVLV